MAEMRRLSARRSYMAPPPRAAILWRKRRGRRVAWREKWRLVRNGTMLAAAW